MMSLRNSAVKLCNVCLLTMKRVIDIFMPNQRQGKLAFFPSQVAFFLRLNQKFELIAELEFDSGKYDVCALLIVQ